MSSPADYLWLIPGLPLLAAVVTAFLGPKILKGQSHWPAVLGAVGACALSFWVFFTLRTDPTPLTCWTGEPWFRAGLLRVDAGLRADTLTSLMLLTVTFVGSLIVIYAIGYMHGDPGYPRFFAVVALFLFSMTGLVLADNLVLLYAFWEGVGVCSYLLIGFWFAKPSAAAAARKAFLVTRLGDVGFLIGILVLWTGFVDPNDPGRNLFSVDFTDVFASAASQNKGLLTAVCLLLFCGAVGKSAQFPLYVWLPDAMEGPTPVSALIHAATMVTAGVYLVARCTPLFAQAPAAQLLVAEIGTFTALLAALIALTQNDLKRVLAYSTVSQLGYMFLALGSGAIGAAIFHLFTHAFFKALLFLSAGSVMHAMGGVIDMRRFSGLRRVLPVTHATFLCGAGALAGVPLLSGFWSKDEILGGAFERGHAHAMFTVLFVVGLVTAGLTAFYTFRGYFLTFWGETRIPPEAGHHAHESPPVMTVPLMVLAVGAVFAGLIAGPGLHLFSHFLGQTHTLGIREEEEMHYGLMALSSVVALAGVALAAWIYLSQPGLAGQLARQMQTLYQMSLNKFHVDELYDFFVVQPMTWFAEFCRVVDQFVVDGVVDLVGHLPGSFGKLFRPIQNGLVQFYALAMTLSVAVFLLAMLWRLPK